MSGTPLKQAVEDLKTAVTQLTGDMGVQQQLDDLLRREDVRNPLQSLFAQPSFNVNPGAGNGANPVVAAHPALIKDYTEDPPEDAAPWPKFYIVCRQKLRADATVAQKNAHANLKSVLADLMTVRCPECGGFGHAKTGCKTKVKLDALMKAQPVVRHFLSEAGKMVTNEDRNPVSVLGKRKRVDLADGGLSGKRMRHS